VVIGWLWGPGFRSRPNGLDRCVRQVDLFLRPARRLEQIAAAVGVLPWRDRRTRADLPALLAWLAIYAALAALPIGVLLDLRLRARVAWGTRPAARPDRTVLAIGLGEGIATIASGVWIAAAYRL